MMAFKHLPEIAGISLVAGNLPMQQGLQNALYIRELCQADTPIYAGCEKPLTRALESAQEVHGEDGMGDIGLVLSGRQANPGHGVEALISAAHKHPGLTLITLGPLTNIATALTLAPEIAAQISQCIIMGGTSDHYGNITPVSEFNIWADPEAAEVVFASALPKVMVGWDISRKYACIEPELERQIRGLNSLKASLAMDIQRQVAAFCANVTGLPGFDLPDPIAMAIAIDPGIILQSQQAAVTVSTNNDLTRGMTILDTRQYLKREKSTRIVTQANAERFIQLLKESLI